MKIFQIGFNKCGTKTIHHYLTANGVRSVHWDHGRLAKRMFTNLADGTELLSGYEDFDAFTDMEYLGESGTYLAAYKLFPYLAAQYPNAVFILNTRDRENWIRSRLHHGSDVSYAPRHMLHHNVNSLSELAECWRSDWDQHHRRVVEFFKSKPYRFFICQIESDLPDLLNKMLPECQLDSKYYRVRNQSKSRPSRPRKKLRRIFKRLQSGFR